MVVEGGTVSRLGLKDESKLEFRTANLTYNTQKSSF